VTNPLFFLCVMYILLLGDLLMLEDDVTFMKELKKFCKKGDAWELCNGR